MQQSHKNSCEISVNEQNILSSWGNTQTTMYLNNGALLKNGEYRIENVLAAGGFGITYLAMQVALGRKVAVKEFFMKDHCNRDSGNSYVSVPSVGSKELVERFKEKFLKEARLIASFDHSNIIRIHDVFEENGTAYYVMEYLEGESLSTLVARCGAIDEQVALRYTRQVADALAEVHAGNLLHLDVKPANIMLNKKGEAVLIDFGISKHYDSVGSQTSSAAVGISEGYAPLEQYEAGALSSFTPATDVYSLGATLYFLLTGQRPPKAGDVMNDGLPVLPSDISPAVRAAIEAAMQPRRKDRPQSVAEFLNLLVRTDNREQSTDNRVQRTDNRVQGVNVKAVKEQNKAIKEESEETRALEKETERATAKINDPVTKPKKNYTAWVVATVLLLVLLIGGYFVLSVNNSSNDSNASVVAVTEDTEKPNLEFITEPATSVVNTDSIVATRVQAYQDSIDAANAAREAAEQQAHEDAARLEREEQARGNAMNGNSGSSAGSGTQGSPGGNSVNGIVANVGNRSALSLSRPANNVQTQGVVLVNVVVRPNGTVESATINARGTNTSDSSLRNAALAAARASKFNAVEGNDNVNGTITYNFN